MVRFDCASSIVPAAWLVVFLALGMVGCEQVEGLIDEATEEQASTPSTPSQQPQQQTQPIQQAKRPEPPQQQVDPRTLASNLQNANPSLITDQDLASVAAVPEAAALMTSISLKNNASITSAALGHLAKMPNLVSVDLSGAGLKEGDYAALQPGMPIKEIKLRNTRLSDAGMMQITQMASLESLDVSTTKVTFNSLLGLKNMPALQSIDLSMNGTVNDDVVATLAGKSLHTVNLTGTRITDASMQVLAGMKTLENLNIGFTKVNGRAFRAFGKDGLRSLNAGETPFGVDGLNAIKGWANLERLELFHAGVVQHNSVKTVFTSLPNLKYLNVAKNEINDAGIKIFFGRMKKIEYLNLGQHAGITDNGLAGLITLKTLKQLDVHGTGVTNRGVVALQQKLPEVRVGTD